MGLATGVLRESEPAETRLPPAPGMVGKYTGPGARVIAEHGIGAGIKNNRA